MPRRISSLEVWPRHCPEVVIDGDQVRIGEAPNTTVLKKEEWNILVDLIQSGRLGRL